MRRVFLMVLLLSAPLLAKPVPVVLWQSERRIEPHPGQTVYLNRRPFLFLLPLVRGEHLGIAGGFGAPPEPLEAFDPGHGMAGPYDGFVTGWDAFHYFYYDPADDNDRVDLWDQARGLTSWEVKKFLQRGRSGVGELPWGGLPSVTVMVRKEGYEDLTFTIKWRSPAESAEP